MNIQTETAINIFNDIYGYPKWQNGTKEGQNYEEIIKLWDNELSPYTVEQIKTACYHIVKYKKNMTYPTISHMLAELVDEKIHTTEENEQQICLRALIKQDPPLPEKVIQRTMWRIYKMKYNGYNPEEDKEG